MAIQQPIGAMGSTGYLIYDCATPGTIGPAVINAYTVLSIPAYWRAMSFLSDNMAVFPRTVRHENTDLMTHRITRLMSKPNRYQNGITFWRTIEFHRSHYLNGFAEIQRDSQFNPTELHVRLPEQIAPFRYLEDDGSISQWYWVGGFRPHIVAWQDMIHLKGLSYDGQSGFNPVFMLSETMERARLQDRYITRFLVKGSIVRGAIQIPAGATRDQQDQIVNDLRTQFSGADAERDLLVLTDGATLNNSTLSPEQSQLIEQATYTTKQIAQITGVNPHFLYDSSEEKYNGNPELAGEEAVRYTFRPRIEEEEAELTLKLLSEQEQAQGYEIEIDTNALTRGDTKSISAMAVAERNAGIVDANEARAELGYPARTDDPDASKLSHLGSTVIQGEKTNE